MSSAKSVANQAEIELLTPARLLSQTEPKPQRTGQRSKPKATFNLNPTYFHIPKEKSTLEETSTTTMEQDFVALENGMSPAQIQALKDQNQKKIKRIVAVVGITLTIISIILVAVSLSFGQKIDEIVYKTINHRQNELSGDKSGTGFFLGTRQPPTTNGETL